MKKIFILLQKKTSTQENKVRLESKLESNSKTLEEKILNLLQTDNFSAAEIARSLGHKNISGGLRKVINHLLKEGKINYTIPERINSRLQKYKLNSSELKK